MGERRKNPSEAVGAGKKEKHEFKFKELSEEERYDEAKKNARMVLKELAPAGSTDDTQVAYHWNEHDFDSNPKIATIGELRIMIEHMEDCNAGGPGYPGMRFTISHLSVGDEFVRRERVVSFCREARLKNLSKWGPLEDDAVIWVTTTKRPQPRKTIVREWLGMLGKLDYAAAEADNEMGGEHIVSIDPNFDPKKWDEENRREQVGMIQKVIDAVENRGRLLEGLEARKDKSLVRLFFPKTGESITLTPKKMRLHIQSLSRGVLEDQEPIFTDVYASEDN
ncbi:MAG: hypothetical protein A2534_01155 [Candidatus Magasanikbacteria bacterium RIFOXYD2_FULL_39_9]|uniref:Uncharacterized protein n=1 Tax=Candidatus Magasanikbacteria bacterium RIFOXYD1_FULL_40_23 TaxID=1798705 RepID=A0A1F6PBF2_9BACT|nr:MAG: hypothetical protein A2534_01155 [Candidatus Magasanikbacteria bacterium RIFOXYD2_FULL_39_9]OGH93284.1 MAG: hypothetical protein A2563_01615 [Candidatus Magasanikbacteria bacterium RIFOXYD1_FULL_40_23]